MKCLIATAAITAALSFTATASAQNVSIVNQASVSPGEVAALEVALTGYAQTLNAVWGSPTVTFTDTSQAAWPILLSATPVTAGNTETGWHAYGVSGYGDGASVPFAEVYWQDPAIVDGGQAFDELAVSHEFAEMLTDPSGTGREIADPVEALADAGRAANGVTLSDFAEPSYFTTAPGAQDWTGHLPALAAAAIPPVKVAAVKAHSVRAGHGRSSQTASYAKHHRHHHRVRR